MVKTTVYLPEDLKVALERLATESERSEAEIIREAIRSTVMSRERPKPRIPLVTKGLGDASAAERVKELLKGFGGR